MAHRKELSVLRGYTYRKRFPKRGQEVDMGGQDWIMRFMGVCAGVARELGMGSLTVSAGWRNRRQEAALVLFPGELWK